MSANQFSNDDPVYQHFMERQRAEGMALAEASDILRLHIPPFAPPHFVAEYLCKGLVRDADGEIKEANRFQVGIWFPNDYLRRADPFEMLRVFTPGVWHPNVSADLPMICIGRLTPNTSLVDILYQIYEILTYFKVQPERGGFTESRGLFLGARESGSLPNRSPATEAPLAESGGAIPMMLANEIRRNGLPRTEQMRLRDGIIRPVELAMRCRERRAAASCRILRRRLSAARMPPGGDS